MWFLFTMFLYIMMGQCRYNVSNPGNSPNMTNADKIASLQKTLDDTISMYEYQEEQGFNTKKRETKKLVLRIIISYIRYLIKFK